MMTTHESLVLNSETTKVWQQTVALFGILFQMFVEIFEFRFHFLPKKLFYVVCTL